MLIFDAHIDTLLRMLTNKETLEEGQGHVDLAKLRQGNIGAQFFAVFVYPELAHGMALHQALEMIDLFWQTLQKHPQELGFAGSGSDIMQLRQEGKTACLLAVEGGESLEGKLAHLRILYRLGVRLLTLTWNHRNELASGQLEGEKGGGLSVFGREVVLEMNRLGMLVDVSHLNDPGFWDVLEISTDPVIASHSNARELCAHPRNLTDEQIRALAHKGGVIGVNFYPQFLVSSGKATVADVVEHARYLANVGGVEAVGLGSDFDGISSTPQGLEDCSKTHLLADELAKAGFSSPDIEKIMGGNFLRISKEVLG